MEIEIITFGRITEFISNQRISIPGLEDTDELKAYLESSFPLLAETRYKLALNRSIVQATCQIKNNDTVAIMPPFSGG